EKSRTIRVERGHNAQMGAPYANLYTTTSMVNQYYFYCVDSDFGPFFIKFSSYFPYNGKLLINGHEYAKRQLERLNIRYEALDNGVVRCDDPATLQRICDGSDREEDRQAPAQVVCPAAAFVTRD